MKITDDTATESTRLKPKSKFNPETDCTGCGSQENVVERPEHGGLLCVRCSTLYALSAASKKHLYAILEQPILEWAKHWRAAGLNAKALAEEVGLMEMPASVQSIILST